jgi:hypothetical protein
MTATTIWAHFGDRYVQLAEIERNIDRAWREAHLAARIFARSGSEDAARRYRLAYLRLRRLTERRRRFATGAREEDSPRAA